MAAAAACATQGTASVAGCGCALYFLLHPTTHLTTSKYAHPAEEPEEEVEEDESASSAGVSRQGSTADFASLENEEVAG